MKAARFRRFGGPEVLEIVDLPDPHPGPGQVRIAVRAAGGAPEHVATIADFGGAKEHWVRFSSGDAGRAVHAIAGIGELIETGRFALPVVQAFPLAEMAAAHRASEDGHVRGKLVLLVGCGGRARPGAGSGHEAVAHPGLGEQVAGARRLGFQLAP